MPSLESLRGGAYRILNPGTAWLVRRRVHPNLLTTVGFLVTLSSAWAFHGHHVRSAGLQGLHQVGCFRCNMQTGRYPDALERFFLLKAGLDQAQHAAVRYSLGYQGEEFLVVHGPEKVSEVRIHDPL